ncbi:hypothetical protein DXC51_11475 [Eisenbergiella massiliensis]|uniref:Uncharacterized protein n=1 Tax=Eisenbergiella massiliensis TaxID=1720294 RepID=A0A3E3I4R6_9FIRM|nr:hypothetical protein DXC51_11475 [Eisenbergiella massiliensis]
MFSCQILWYDQSRFREIMLCLPQPERVSVRYSAAGKCALSPAPLPAHAVLTTAFSLPMQLPVF